MNVVDAWAEMSEGMVLTTELKATFKAAALKDAHKSLAKLEAAASDEEQYYALPRGAFAAFNLGQFDDAKRCAEQALTLADNFKDNWNFGNAVHRANSVRGLLALQDDDRAERLLHCMPRARRQARRSLIRLGQRCSWPLLCLRWASVTQCFAISISAVPSGEWGPLQ